MKIISNKPEFKSRRKYLRNNCTNAEQLLWNSLSGRKLKNCKFRRQHGFGLYIVDFYCSEKHLVIEVDGDSHFTKEGKEYDAQRSLYLENLNLKVVRFCNDEIFHDLENVLKKILLHLDTPPNLPYK